MADVPHHEESSSTKRGVVANLKALFSREMHKHEEKNTGDRKYNTVSNNKDHPKHKSLSNASFLDSSAPNTSPSKATSGGGAATTSTSTTDTTDNSGGYELKKSSSSGSVAVQVAAIESKSPSPRSSSSISNFLLRRSTSAKFSTKVETSDPNASELKESQKKQRHSNNERKSRKKSGSEQPIQDGDTGITSSGQKPRLKKESSGILAMSAPFVKEKKEDTPPPMSGIANILRQASSGYLTHNTYDPSKQPPATTSEDNASLTNSELLVLERAMSETALLIGIHGAMVDQKKKKEEVNEIENPFGYTLKLDLNMRKEESIKRLKTWLETRPTKADIEHLFPEIASHTNTGPQANLSLRASSPEVPIIPESHEKEVEDDAKFLHNAKGWILTFYPALKTIPQYMYSLKIAKPQRRYTLATEIGFINGPSHTRSPAVRANPATAKLKRSGSSELVDSSSLSKSSILMGDDWDVPAYGIAPDGQPESRYIKHWVAARTISTYPRSPDGFGRDGDPICDRWELRLWSDRAVVAVADGCGWGEKAKNAAVHAIEGFLAGLMTNQSKWKVLQDVANALVQGLAKAHERVLDGDTDGQHGRRSTFHGAEKKNDTKYFNIGTTTLLGGILLKMEYSDLDPFRPRWLFVCANIGDCKAFLLSRRKITEITPDSRSAIADCTDPGGRLGPQLAEGKPDTRNLRLFVHPCSSDDIIMMMSDGSHDNFDPEMLGVPPPANCKRAAPKTTAKAGACTTAPTTTTTTTTTTAPTGGALKWSDVDPEDAANAKALLMCRFMEDLIGGETDPRRITELIVDHCEFLTRKSRRWMETNRGKRLPKDMAQFPGKMDHTTIVCFRVPAETYLV